MRSSALFLIIVFLIVSFPEICPARNLDGLKKAYQYDTWPVEQGPIRQPPALDSLKTSRLQIVGKESVDKGIEYRFGDAPGKTDATVTVRTFQTTESARTGLIEILANYSSILERAENHGLPAGDAGFVSISGPSVSVALVKDNIVIQAATTGKGTMEDLKELLKAVESAI